MFSSDTLNPLLNLIIRFEKEHRGHLYNDSKYAHKLIFLNMKRHDLKVVINGFDFLVYYLLSLRRMS